MAARRAAARAAAATAEPPPPPAEPIPEPEPEVKEPEPEKPPAPEVFSIYSICIGYVRHVFLKFGSVILDDVTSSQVLI